MSSSTYNVFITGANRGLGRALAEIYLSRPQHLVIAAVRDTETKNAKELERFTPAAGSRVILVKLDSARIADAAAAVRAAQSAVPGLDKLDLVIANAGITSEHGKIMDVDLARFEELLSVNTLAPVALFKATKALLEKSDDPKWVSMSSSAGSIGMLDEVTSQFAVGYYGASKAGLNWISRALHWQNEGITVVAVHPGLVATDMGNASTDYFGGILRDYIIPVSESVKGLTALFDKATRKEHSGNFYNYDGTVIPW